MIIMIMMMTIISSITVIARITIVRTLEEEARGFLSEESIALSLGSRVFWGFTLKPKRVYRFKGRFIRKPGL